MFSVYGLIFVVGMVVVLPSIMMAVRGAVTKESWNTGLWYFMLTQQYLAVGLTFSAVLWFINPPEFDIIHALAFVFLWPVFFIFTG